MARIVHHLHSGVLAGLLGVLLASGCAPSYMSQREHGFHILQRDIDTVPQNSHIEERVVLPRLHIVLAGGPQQLHARMQNGFLEGPVVWGIGKRVQGRIVVNEAVLGAQLHRLLHQHTDAIAAPGLTGSAARYRKGLTAIQQSFDALPPAPELNAVITLQNVQITLVGSRQQLQAASSDAAAFHSSTLGYATPENAICVVGSRSRHGMATNVAVLGHELTHLLHFAAPAIADPDQLNTLFAAHRYSAEYR